MISAWWLLPALIIGGIIGFLWFSVLSVRGE
jgi:hypothetical protein